MSGSLLCLLCRQAGHKLINCQSNQPVDEEFTWFFSKQRKEMNFGDPAQIADHPLCTRCQELDVLKLLAEDMPWENTSELNNRARGKEQNFRSLGTVATVEYWDNCPLCLCLFALTPNPSFLQQDVLLIPDWSMNRLAGETDTVSDTTEWRHFAKCLLVAYNDKEGSMEFATRAHRGDALCVVDADDSEHTLGGRNINPRDLNVEIAQTWLQTCEALHSSKCSPARVLPTIKLVDVNDRKIVETSSEDRAEYITLSYVWGNVRQRSYQLGDRLDALPQTIEDAIQLVEKLGKRYLWVDSLCIDQSDEEDKKRQINSMANIYMGSYLTIIALSGDSVEVGLPRLSQSSTVFPQLKCHIEGKRLVGLMPTLSQQIWRAPWGGRAWTLQEALLAPRSLYVGDHQMYFECNGMQCCESLDQSRSWAHRLHVGPNPNRGGWLASKVGDGCLRTPIDLPSQRMERYGSKLTLYSYRSMTDPSDALDAFSGILDFLSSMYTKGFYHGLPLEDFQWGLLWRSQYPPARRSGFPSWSWTGWKGGIWVAFPADFTKPHANPVHLHIWKLENNDLVSLFESTHLDLAENDPIGAAAQTLSADPEFSLSEVVDFSRSPSPSPSVSDRGHLYIEAIVLEFVPDYTRPLSDIRQSGQYAFYLLPMDDIRCFIRIMSVDKELDPPQKDEKASFILLARDHHDGLVFHHLLQVEFNEDGTASRRTVLELVVHDVNLPVLRYFDPRRRRVVLV